MPFYRRISPRACGTHELARFRTITDALGSALVDFRPGVDGEARLHGSSRVDDRRTVGDRARIGRRRHFQPASHRRADDDDGVKES